jgi:hypothetical protein
LWCLACQIHTVNTLCVVTMKFLLSFPNLSLGAPICSEKTASHSAAALCICKGTDRARELSSVMHQRQGPPTLSSRDQSERGSLPGLRSPLPFFSQTGPNIIFSPRCPGALCVPQPQSEDLLDYRPDEPLGRHFTDLSAPESQPQALALLGEEATSTPLPLTLTLLDCDKAGECGRSPSCKTSRDGKEIEEQLLEALLGRRRHDHTDRLIAGLA